MSTSTTITRRFEWDMGHRVPDHRSLCRNLHGHRYVVEITAEGPVTDESGHPENGMVHDFSVLKDHMGWILHEWDHALMMDRKDPWLKFIQATDTKLVLLDHPPTAERIAEAIFSRLELRGSVNGVKLNIVEITVWETPNCKATFRPQR